MYAILEIRIPNGHLVGMIESFNRRYVVSYAENNFLRKSLEAMITGGIDVVNCKKKRIYPNQRYS